jgi:hypothetical protein
VGATGIETVEGGPGRENYPGAMRSFLLYAVVRLGLWVALWWLLTLLDVGVMLAGVLAAAIAMLISILFLDRLRDAAAMRWKAADERRAQRRGPEVDEDAEYEDSLLDDAGDEVAEDGEADGRPPGGAEEEGARAAQLPDVDVQGRDESGPTPDEVRGADR